MERSKSLELHLTEAELETLINAIRACNGRLAELVFKLREAWRGSLSQSTMVWSLLMLVDRVAG